MFNPEAPQEALDFYYLVRNIEWRYRLDQAEAEVIAQIRRLLDDMRQELTGRVTRYAEGTYTRARLEALLAEIEVYSAAVQRQTAITVAEAYGIVGTASLREQYEILSVGGVASNVIPVSMNVAEFSALVMANPLSGSPLQAWVNRAFQEGQEQLYDALRTGMFQGETYRDIVRRVLREAQDITEREAITLTRTYVQSANVSAQEAAYEANKDIVGWVEWSAVLESGYKQTGRGTCIRCSALDGQRWKQDDKNRPPCPLHCRCRCTLLPVVDWEGLGLSELDMGKAVRPYTERVNKNIDTGGKREITAYGQHKGSWGSWAEGRKPEFKINAIGPQRYDLWQQWHSKTGGTFETFMHRLVDRSTGELYTVRELERMLQ